MSNSTPALMDAGTTLDATTQPGFAGQPLIYLNGLNLAPVGFRLYSPSNTIRGFAINLFGTGIYGDDSFSSPFGGFNVIEGNYIGTDLTSSGSVNFQTYGIYFISGCPSNRIGGAVVAARNVISGNRRAGIFWYQSPSNTLAGNFVGLDRTGSNAVPNGVDINPISGVFAQSCPGTIIGGNTPGAGNVISANGSLFGKQLLVWGDCPGSVVQGNFIGTDLLGRTNVGGLGAIDVTGTGLVLIKSNLLSGAGLNNGVYCGIYLASSSNRLEGNLMGTDLTGTRAIANGPCGVFVDSAGTGNMIGGTNSGSRNLISGGGYAITLKGQSNLVQGNLIGTLIDGVSPLTNFFDGVLVQNSFNQIGGTAPGQGNTIAFSVGSGVNVSAGTNNAVVGNSIFSNVGLGIDLGTAGATTNDLGDLDAGANNLQNFPVLSAARNIGSATLLQGTLNSRANTQYRLEFFANTNCHPSGFGQGRHFLNATTATTDAAGNATIFFMHPTPVPAGQVLTATATDPNNNTSEFSPCVTVVNDTNYVVLSFTTASPYSLAWPTSAVGFLLERATNLTPPTVWQVVSNGIATNAGNKVFAITNASTAPTLFFRLRRP